MWRKKQVSWKIDFYFPTKTYCLLQTKSNVLIRQSCRQHFAASFNARLLLVEGWRLTCQTWRVSFGNRCRILYIILGLTNVCKYTVFIFLCQPLAKFVIVFSISLRRRMSGLCTNFHYYFFVSLRVGVYEEKVPISFFFSVFFWQLPLIAW